MSEQFNIGDDVIVVNDREVWLDHHDLPNDTILSVVEKHDNEYHYVDGDNLLIEIEALCRFPEDFQVVSKPKENQPTLLNAQPPIGALGDVPETIIPMTRIETEETVRAEDIGQFVEDRVRKIIIPHNCGDDVTPEMISGIYRPDLNTRKIGKVRVELVDDGFPLAIRELSKLMTWAQEAKGYRDHDWQNLPNWEIALAAATSRHRTDFIKQRVVEGLEIDECVDPESGLLHKVHEAFGVLAQLELMLRNKSK